MDPTAALRAPIGVGIVGGGFMAEVHSRAARAARGRLIGIVGSSPDRSRDAADRLGIETAVDSLEALLADDRIDVVHVCTPNATHRDIAAAALAAGKHVVCEKPLATTSTDAIALRDQAAAAGRVGAVPFVYRYHPIVREARARVARGDLGRLLTVKGQYLQDWLLTESDENWRVDPKHGGASRAFADIGSHLVDIVEFVTGDRITRLAATTRTFITERGAVPVTTEDAAALVVQTAGGAIGTLLVSQVAAGRKNALSFELSGATEAYAFEQEQPESLWIGRRRGSELLMRDGAELAPDAARVSVLPSGHPLGYQDAFTAFVTDAYAAITGSATGASAPDGMPTFDDGVRAALVTEAVLESAATGVWVDLAQPSIVDERSAA
jgi:predicted dehydrogenase